MPLAATLSHPRMGQSVGNTCLELPLLKHKLQNKKDSLKRALDAWASEMSEGRDLEGWRAGEMSGNVVPGRTRM